jgi:thiol peroxidase
VTERNGVITLKGNPVTLEGEGVQVGQKAPAFTVLANDMSPKTLADFAGRTVVLSVVPSLDTPVCDVQTRRFNEEAGKLGDKVAVLTISMDLPMAQKRWCGANNATNVVTLSDYKDRSFAQAFGLRIKQNGLLARALYVIDKDGVIQYEQIVPEIAQEPDYDAVLAAVTKLA